MMGMIFRTDDHQYLSQQAILSLTKDAVSGAIDNPEELTTYSWRRMLPTLGLKCKFSKPERLALGDWKDAKARGDEAPITLRYADGKQCMSKICKLICADVLSTLTTMKIQTFEEVPPQQWRQSRQRLEPKWNRDTPRSLAYGATQTSLKQEEDSKSRSPRPTSQ